MISKLAAVFVLLCIVQIQSFKVQQPGNICGETIQISDQWEDISITYKQNEPYGANERCVWTIRVPGARNAEITLMESGINGTDPDEGISISYFRLANAELFERTDFIRNTGDNVAITQVDLLIVTFVSGSDPKGTGFVLNYSSNNASSTVSRNSVDFIFNSLNGSLNYPESGNYSNSELSTFIFAPPQFNLNSAPELHTEWRLNGLESNCLDVVVLFKFYTDAGWSRYTAYCQTTDAKLASHNDMILMMFKTDGSIVSSGFEIKWYHLMDGTKTLV